ncbi:MFS siderochrome iron transporter 1 [Exophiala bonariae]|uniref:MFS siderochrome iron transporter 1 n=1 Tax=Exophiala bonariae TaxID=1690606 RepID=A0AAV9N614_9EURO|nr:MFS siderochrome iron transporter 1 [Exophiala bonariae]
MATAAAATASSSTLNDSLGEDVENQTPHSSIRNIPHWRLVASQSLITDEVLNHRYEGSGTAKDPYVVEFIAHDPRNPMEWPLWKKWSITLLVAVATLAVSFVSSAYSGGIKQVIEVFGCSQEVATLGLSLFVLGFAVGPLLWAPLSELYGRQILFFATYALLTLFNAAAAASNSITTLLVLRFLAGTFGSSPLTNAGGVIADMFPANQRGLALGIFAVAPFLGPALGPIVGGFSGEALGFRWLEGIMACFTGVLWILGSLAIPETYAPVLLKRRAEGLSKRTGKTYVSMVEHKQGKQSPAAAFKKAIIRPWILLILEPIVLLISIYMAILYGTLFLLFGAFPIVFQQGRGWSQGVGGLAFLGVAVGMVSGTAYAIYDNGRYNRLEAAHGGEAPPEEGRLPPAMIGAIAIPIGMFWFAWTNSPSIHWIVCIMACVPFGFGMVLVFLPCMNYLIDAYTIYAASVLAANSVLRSSFGAAFPLFTDQMYAKLGIHWASSIPAFLALACTPLPFIFYKYGESIRMKCKYSAQAHEAMAQLRLSRQKTNDLAQGGTEEGTEEK